MLHRRLHQLVALLIAAGMGLFALTMWARPAAAADPPADLEVQISEPPDVITYPPNPPHDQAQPGDTVRYGVELNNLGSGGATAVALRVDLSSSLTFVRFLGDPACTYTAGTIVCQVGDVPAGPAEVYVMSFEATIGAQATSIDASATVSSSSLDSNPSNDTDTSHVAFDEKADLSSQLSLDGKTPDQVIAGETFRAVLIVTNNGPSPAYNVDVRLGWSESVSFSYFDGRCDVSLEQRTVRCLDGGPLNPGQTVYLAVDLTVNADASGPITVTGQGTAGTTDPDSSNNTVSLTLTPATSADLAVAVAPDDATGPRGQTITWTQTASNRGPSVARAVVMTNRLPAGVSLVSKPAGCTVSGRVVTCPRGDLAVGDTVTVQLNCRVIGHVSTKRFTDQAEVTSTTPDPNAPNMAESTVTRG